MGSDELVARLRKRANTYTWDSATFYISDAKAMREAADEIEALTAQLAEARESERAAVVAYLRSEPTKNWTWKALAQSIGAGEHLT